MSRLILEDGPDKGTQIDLGDADRTAIVGRSAKADVVCSDPLMSRQHFRLEMKGGKLTVTDLLAHNGTHVNGAKIDSETQLNTGDRIRAGHTVFLVRLKGSGDAGALAGRRVGDYMLHERIGVGGMGEIYKATQVSLGRTIALKILSTELTKDTAFVEKFLSEARAAGRLNHPNVVQVHEVGQDAGVYYFSMEYIAGGSVQDIIRGGEKVDPKRAVDIVIAAAKALQYAEKQGVVHCDVKPDNLMLTEDGDVRLADLGIARRMHEGRKVIQEEGVFGSPHYMAPEQAKGQPIDSRVDIYALGCTFYRMLAGRTPFIGEDPREIMEKQVYETPTPLKEMVPDLPRGIYAVVDRMMRKNPRDRYQTAAELGADLEQVREELAEGKPVHSTAVHTRTAPRVRARRSAGVGIGVALLAVIGLVVMLIIMLARLDSGAHEAQDCFERAGRCAEQGEYDRAIELLEKAGRLTNDPELLARIQAEASRLRVVEDQSKLEGAFQAEMDAIDRFVSENPDSRLEARNRYSELAKRYHRLSASAVAARKSDEQNALHQQRAETEWQRAKAASDRAVAEGRYGEAWRTWDDFPKTFDGTDAGVKAAAEAEAVKARTEADYAAALARADVLIGEGSFTEASRVLDGFIYDAGLPDYKARAARDKDAIRAKIDKASAQAASARREQRKEDAEALIMESETLRRAYAFAAGRDALREAESIFGQLGLKKEAAEIPELIEPMNRQKILFESLVEKTRSFDLSSNAVRLADGRAGRAVGATETTVTLSLTGGGTVVLPWGTLPPKEVLSLARGADIPPEQVLSLGLFCLEHGLAEDAIEEFTRAGRLRRALKPEAQSFIEIAKLVAADAASKIVASDAKAHVARVERLISRRDSAGAKEGLVILRSRYLPAGAVELQKIEELERMLPGSSRPPAAGGGPGGGATGAPGSQARPAAADDIGGILERVAAAVERVVSRKVGESLAVYERRGENVACGDMLLAAGKPAEAHAAYGRELSDANSWWNASGALSVRIAAACIDAGDADSLAKASELLAKVPQDAPAGVRAEAQRLSALAGEVSGLRRSLGETEREATAARDASRFGGLAETLASKMPGSLAARVAAERVRLAFPQDPRVADGRACLWILRHRFHARDLDGVWDEITAFRTEHPELARTCSAELDLIEAEGRFNAGQWLKAKERFEAFKAAAAPGSELITDGTVERRLKRCAVELSAAGTRGGGD